MRELHHSHRSPDEASWSLPSAGDGDAAVFRQHQETRETPTYPGAVWQWNTSPEAAKGASSNVLILFSSPRLGSSLQIGYWQHVLLSDQLGSILLMELLLADVFLKLKKSARVFLARQVYLFRLLTSSKIYKSDNLPALWNKIIENILPPTGQLFSCIDPIFSLTQKD